MLLDVHQQTPEWHALRSKSIGASDAPIILGVNPWKSPYQLWLEKLGLHVQEVNANMIRGNQLEAEVREKISYMTGFNFVPCVAKSKEFQYMIASLDGYDSKAKKAVEIKCPNSGDHALACMGIVPEKYIPQLQHQMFVLEISEIMYCSYDGQNIAHVEVKRNNDYLKKLLEQEFLFWSYLQDLIPPPLTNKDYVVKDDPEWQELAKEYHDIICMRNHLEVEEEKIKNRIIELAGGQNAKGCGITIQKIVRKGTVDYKKIPELKDVDLEIYRKPNSTYNRITLM